MIFSSVVLWPIYQKFEPKELRLETGFIEEHAQAVEEAESKRTI
jgi:hypothetical protein